LVYRDPAAGYTLYFTYNAVATSPQNFLLIAYAQILLNIYTSVPNEFALYGLMASG